MGNFTLNFQIPLESQQTCNGWRRPGPTRKKITTEYLEQYQRRLFDNSKLPPPSVNFLLGSDEKIVSTSAGLDIFADVENLPLHERTQPERLWKLQKEITNSGELKYPTEIQITLLNADHGHYLITPKAPVTLETFRQMLRCLPWVKMYGKIPC